MSGEEESSPADVSMEAESSADDMIETRLDLLGSIAERLAADGEVPGVSVREFLGWFGAQRRGYWIVQNIRQGLDAAGLRTEPDFESAFIDAELKFELATQAAPTAPADVSPEVAETLSVEEHREIRVVAAPFGDPTNRVSKLGAANRVPVSIKPDASLAEVVTVLMANDFSQVPVMTNERDVKGIISWRSIGSRIALGQSVTAARQAMDPQAEISLDASLFSAIPLIVEHQYVLVRGPDQRIVGIVTTSDLSLQFQQLAEPFLLLGEIENHIRRIIGDKFSHDELIQARDPSDDSRAITSVADLTFGEYGRLLEAPNRWDRLNLQLDRVAFRKLLDRVRDIRNDVMHFDPDGVPDADLDALRDFSRFLRTLQTIGVT
jgi:CBS domain-containing protein